MAKWAKTATIEHYRQPGSRLWFEYHCWESHESGDAVLWYRSHEQCTVLRCINEEDYGFMSLSERCETGHALVYRVRFDDGFEYEAFEDELVDSPSEFFRPDPPKNHHQSIDKSHTVG